MLVYFFFRNAALPPVGVGKFCTEYNMRMHFTRLRHMFNRHFWAVGGSPKTPRGWPFFFKSVRVGHATGDFFGVLGVTAQLCVLVTLRGIFLGVLGVTSQTERVGHATRDFFSPKTPKF